MKSIELKAVTVGNFSYDATLAITPEVEAELLRQGALRILQGKVSGTWEKSQGYPDAKKRPEGFKRTDIPFSQAAADKLASEYRKAVVTVDDKELPLGIESMVVSEYTPGSGPEPKYKAIKDFINGYLVNGDGTPKLDAQGNARTIGLFAEKRGLAAPTEPWSEDTAFLAEAQAWYREELAKQD